MSTKKGRVIPTMIANNVTTLARAAKVADIPCMLTTVIEERGGLLIKQIQEVYPEPKPIHRYTGGNNKL